MRMNRRWMILFIVVAFAVGITACHTPAGRSAGNVVDDGTITSKIKAKLIADEKLSAFGIDVDTFQGNVTMTGGVKTEADKDHAAQVAKSTEGVKKVNNLIKVMGR